MAAKIEAILRSKSKLWGVIKTELRALEGQYTSRRPRFQGEHRSFRGDRFRRQTAGGLHDEQRGGNAKLAQAGT